MTPFEEYRTRYNLTQEQFAELASVSQTLVSLVERGRRKVPALRVLSIEKATGIPRHTLRPDLYPEEPRQAIA